jgi:hypothetical protein
LPIKAVGLLAKLPVVGSKKMREDAKLLDKSFEKMEGIKELFFFFLNTEYIFEQKMDDVYMSLMSPEDKKLFFIDAREINWEEMVSTFAYGIRRYYIKEDCLPLKNGEMDQIVRK